MTIRCVIAGCGMVADEYARTLSRSRTIDLIACTDIDRDRAHAFAQRHAIPNVATLDRLDADLVIVLAPPAHHVAVTSAAVQAGIPAYIEKPLAVSARDAKTLLALAHRNGVPVGAAPDTFLAPPAQAAAKAIAAGLIGEPVAATAALLSAGPERWHPNPEPIYDLGPLLDMGPYYLTTLIHLLGPITDVDGASATGRPTRTNTSGVTFTVEGPTHLDALLRTRARVPVTLTTSFDIQATTRPHLEIYGTEGTLVLPDPNFHTGAVQIRRRDDGTWRTLQQPASPFDVVGRGMGVLDLAEALRTGRPVQATGEFALHILQVMETVREAAASGVRCAVPPLAAQASVGGRHSHEGSGQTAG